MTNTSDSMFGKRQVFSATRSISYIIMGIEDNLFDFDASYQRGYVWTSVQQQELLFSVFNNFSFGSATVIEHPITGNTPYIEVVDGKQKMLTLYKFYKNEFPYICEKTNRHVYFSDLSGFDQRRFKNNVTLPFNSLESNVTELEKLEFFHAVNFSGIPQSNEHKLSIENKIKELKKCL